MGNMEAAKYQGSDDPRDFRSDSSTLGCAGRNSILFHQRLDATGRDGLHQGGCVDTTSYSSPFTPAVYALLARAAAHRTPDLVREPGSDGC